MRDLRKDRLTPRLSSAPSPGSPEMAHGRSVRINLWERSRRNVQIRIYLNAKTGFLDLTGCLHVTGSLCEASPHRWQLEGTGAAHLVKVPFVDGRHSAASCALPVPPTSLAPRPACTRRLIGRIIFGRNVDELQEHTRCNACRPTPRMGDLMPGAEVRPLAPAPIMAFASTSMGRRVA